MSSGDLVPMRKLMLVDGPHRGKQVETDKTRLEMECDFGRRGIRIAIYDLQHIDRYYYFTFRGWKDEGPRGMSFEPRILKDQEIEHELVFLMTERQIDPTSPTALLWNALHTAKQHRLDLRERTAAWHEQCVKAGIYTHSKEFDNCDVTACHNSRTTLWA